MKTYLLSFACLILSQGIVSFGNASGSSLPETATSSHIPEILKRIFEKNPEITTFSASFRYSEKNATNSDEDKSTLKWKSSINSFLRIRNDVPFEKEKDENYNYVTSFLYFNNGRITTFETLDKKVKGKKWKSIGDHPSAFVYHGAGAPAAMYLASPFVSRIAIFEHKLPLFIKMNSQKTFFEFVDYNGDKCFQIRLIVEGKSEKEYQQKYEFLFKLKDALLVKKSVHLKSGNFDELTEYYFENYIKTNNVFFPTKLTERIYSNKKDSGAITTYIDKDSLKINEPIPDEVFIPTIPEGMIVDDRIQKRKYIATGISSPQKEKIITDELDRIINESEK